MANIDYEKINEKMVSQLKHIFDPEIPVNIYDLGLIYELNLEEIDNRIVCNVVMTLTSPGCPVADSLVADVNYALRVIDEIDEVNVNLTFEPPWDKSKVSDEGQEIMMSFGFII